MYLLDTNACIRILNDASSPLIQRLANHAPSEIRLCSIVKAELLYGARHSQRVAENLNILARFFAPFVSLPFNDRCAGQYGQIRAELAQVGTLIKGGGLRSGAAQWKFGPFFSTLCTRVPREYNDQDNRGQGTQTK